MKPIDVVEPRVAVNSLPGSATAVHRIESPGSYYLAGDITGEPGKHGIEIIFAGATVSIDLNGFNVRGVPGSLDGIRGTATTRITNGTIRDFGGSGIDVSQGIITDVYSTANAQFGIRGAWGNVIERCVTEGNGSHGVSVGDVSRISGCVSKVNAGLGIQLDGAGTVTDCVAYNNTLGGIRTGLARIDGCLLFNNIGVAIETTGFARITDNDVSFSTQGILVTGDHNTVSGNTIVSCATGVDVPGSDNRIEANAATMCGTGFDVAGARNVVIRNSASSSTVADFAVAPGNTAGPIVTNATIGTDGNPHANYAQ